MEELNWGLLAPILVIQLILAVLAFVDLMRAERTNGPKLLWGAIILLFSLFGPVLYFIFGRRRD